MSHILETYAGDSSDVNISEVDTTLNIFIIGSSPGTDLQERTRKIANYLRLLVELQNDFNSHTDSSSTLHLNSTQVNKINKIGTATLETTATTICEAINELHGEVLPADVLTIDNDGPVTLTDTTHALLGASYHTLRYADGISINHNNDLVHKSWVENKINDQINLDLQNGMIDSLSTSYCNYSWNFDDKLEAKKITIGTTDWYWLESLQIGTSIFLQAVNAYVDVSGSNNDFGIIEYDGDTYSLLYPSTIITENPGRYLVGKLLSPKKQYYLGFRSTNSTNFRVTLELRG